MKAECSLSWNISPGLCCAQLCILTVPSVCRAYPKDGAMSFENIVVQVDGATVTPNWAAKQEQPACSSKCTIVDAKTIKFTWDPATDAQVPEHSQRRKWSAVEEKPMGFSLDDTPLM